jgi:membrane protease YdiL (CAAX protease family)
LAFLFIFRKWDAISDKFDILNSAIGKVIIMTETPDSTPSPRSRSRLRTAIPWFFIIATVALIQIPQLKTASVPKDYAQDLSLQLLGKYIVGIRYLLGQNPAFSNSIETMKQPLQRYKDTQSRLLIVPIMAELSGREAAIKALEQITPNPDDNNVKRDAPLFLQLYRDGESSLSPQQHQSIKDYGWLGQLALSQGDPDTSPERKAILHSALRTFFLIVLCFIVMLGALIAGIIVLTVAIVLWTKGRLRRRLVMPNNPQISLLQGFAIYLTGFGALPLLLHRLMPGSRPGAIVLAVLAVIAGALWPRFCGSNWKDYRASIGWQRGRGFFREIGAGIVGYIAGLPLLFIASIFVAMISRYAGKMPMHPIDYEINRGPLHMLFWTLMACVWAPIVEETFFRGVLFGYLRRRLPWALSGILVALVFAAIHPQGLIGIPLLAAIGFTLSAIREWRGSLIASMSAHALNNAFAVLVLIFILG